MQLMLERKRLVPELYKLLAHLNDIAYLENHPLAKYVPASAITPTLSRGQALRRILRLAIAALDPGVEGNSDALEARPYRVLYRYAISRHSMLTIANQLSISQRQAYRELRCAIEALASVLSDKLTGPEVAGEPEPASADTSGVRTEAERLAGDTEEVEMGALAEDAIKRVVPLAQEHGVDMKLVVEFTPLYSQTNRILLRQAMLSLLSHAIRATREGLVRVRVYPSRQRAVLEISYRGDRLPDAEQLQSSHGTAVQILESLGITPTTSLVEQGLSQLSLSIPLLQQPAVLIVDDNEGLIRLFKSFLRDQPYQVHGATNADQALELFRQVQPDVVLLDIMMPRRDGWEVLEALRTADAGHRAAVIICSVINDPQLSAALGADGFLPKPVERSALLQAIERALSSRK